MIKQKELVGVNETFYYLHDIFWIVIVAFAGAVARFMIDNDEVVRLTVIFIWLLGSMQPLMAIEFSRRRIKRCW